MSDALETIVQEAIEEWATIHGGPVNQFPDDVSLARYITSKVRAALTAWPEEAGDALPTGHPCHCGDPTVLGVAHRSHECRHIGPQLDV